MKFVLLTLIVFEFALIGFAQVGIISGTVVDDASREAIPDVNIIFSGWQFNTSTDNSGYFNVSNLPAGIYRISFSHAGYKSEIITVELKSSGTKNLVVKLFSTPIKMGEVLVSSTKYETKLKDVPLPMDVITGDKIKNEYAISVPDLLSNEPGLALGRDGIWGTTISIRGLSRSSIVTLIDGCRIETATDLAAGLSLIDVNDIKRIEVIKGAASSLYGTGALGGIVNIITKSGEYTDHISTGGSLTSGYNSVNSGSEGNLSLNAGASNWYVHVAGTLRDAGNTKTPSGVLSNSQFQDRSISTDIGLKPFKDNELIIDYQKFYADNVGIPGGSQLFPAIARVTYPVEERDLFSAQYSWKNVSSSILNISAKYFYQYIFRDVENIPYLVSRVPASNGQPAKETGVLKITPNARHYTNGIQLQTDWALGKSNYLVAGIDAWQRSLDSRRERYLQIKTFSPNGDSVISITNQIVGEKPIPESSFRSVGLFVQDEIPVIKNRMKLTLGGRFDQIHITNSAVSNPVYVIVNGARNNSPSSQTLYWEAGTDNNYSWSGNIGFIYSLSRAIDITLTAARSFRSPSLEERYQYIDLGNLVELGNPGLKPERGYFFNSGLRIWDERLSLTLDIFLNNLTDLVVQEPGTYEGRAALIESNVGKARLYGFDLGTEYNVLYNFTLYANASYVRGRDIANNLDLPQIPPFNAKIGIRSRVIDFINADLSAITFASQNRIAPGEISTPGYTYFDLYLSTSPLNLGFTKLNILGGIENITNREYRNHLATNRGLITSEPGRNFFLKMSFSW